MKEFKGFKVIESFDKKHEREIIKDLHKDYHYTFNNHIYNLYTALKIIIDIVVINELNKESKKDLLKKYNLLKDSILEEDLWESLDITTIEEFYEERKDEEGYEEGYECFHFSISPCLHGEIIKILEEYFDGLEDGHHITKYKFDEMWNESSNNFVKV